MQANVGKTEKVIRIVAGVAIIGAGVATGSWWGAVGLVPLVTGLVNWCPAYQLVGVSTCKVKPSE